MEKYKVELDISNFDHFEEFVLFGFPGDSKIFNVITFGVLIKIINSNKIDFYDYLIQLKQSYK